MLAAARGALDDGVAGGASVDDSGVSVGDSGASLGDSGAGGGDAKGERGGGRGEGEGGGGGGGGLALMLSRKSSPLATLRITCRLTSSKPQRTSWEKEAPLGYVCTYLQGRALRV